uniref:Uncharacterized protein n=1 Tax=Schistosoma haematobium TaxID=6185 RepID=A0A095ADV1_SCHHA
MDVDLSELDDWLGTLEELQLSSMLFCLDIWEILREHESVNPLPKNKALLIEPVSTGVM